VLASWACGGRTIVTGKPLPRHLVDAVNNGGRPPSSVGDHRLVQLPEPYVSNLKAVNDPLPLAKQDGSHGNEAPDLIPAQLMPQWH
jgi:hypothetical protein